ncbi:MAG TPA: hypothetical protein VJV78_29320 [Polyangiales bacterium]|nr:hypothetical protein [Polyangiales bacterium]
MSASELALIWKRQVFYNDRMAPRSPTAVAARARTCLAKAVPIPSAPLWNMGRAALGSKSNYDEMQTAIDYLTCKAQASMAFTADEKTFMKELYESFSFGGSMKGFDEAAQLANHYVNGGGAKLTINSTVYQSSVIVKDASAAIKDYIRDLLAKKRPFQTVSTADPKFIKSPFTKALLLGSGRNVGSQGYLIKTGYLLTEQNNERLQKANNRFVLSAVTSGLAPTRLSTRWSVNDYYEFEPFARAPGMFTNIPLGSYTLKIADGLSHYMVTQGIAKAFDYSSEWTEAWSV